MSFFAGFVCASLFAMVFPFFCCVCVCVFLGVCKLFLRSPSYFLVFVCFHRFCYILLYFVIFCYVLLCFAIFFTVFTGFAIICYVLLCFGAYRPAQSGRNHLAYQAHTSRCPCAVRQVLSSRVGKSIAKHSKNIAKHRKTSQSIATPNKTYNIANTLKNKKNMRIVHPRKTIGKT